MSGLRISTAGLYAQGLNGLLQQQKAVARTQQELVSQSKLHRAADDPSGMAQAQRLDHAVASLVQNGRNANTLEHRLRSQETALTDVGSQLTRARELAIQANTGALSPADRKLIADELRAIRSEVLSIANRGDGTGRQLFAGTRDGAAPFVDNGGSVSYAGNDGRNLVQVAPDLSLADTDAGSDVFMRVRSGDGTIRGRADAGNSGGGVLQATSVADHAAWAGRALRVEFTSADAWRVVDDSGAELATGAYVAGSTISAGGMQVTVSGTPAPGDSFAVQRAPAQDVFATLQTLADALDAPASTAADQARRQNAIGAAIGDLDTAQDHMLSLRTTTGTRLASIDNAVDTRDAHGISLAESLSALRDVDIAEAATRLALQMSALEAAQKTMLRVQSMSLFDRM